MNRLELLTCRQSLLAVRETVVLNRGRTVAIDAALASIRDALTSTAAVNGSPAKPPSQTEYVTIATAAKSLRLSRRRMRDIAESIGGIKVGRDWMVPKDSLPEPETEDDNE